MAFLPRGYPPGHPELEVPNRAVDMDSRALPVCYPRRNFWPMISPLSMKRGRFTRAGFPLCSRCPDRSQAGFCSYTLRVISIHPKPTLCTPPLLFRRQMPHLNYPGGTFPRKTHPSFKRCASFSWVRIMTSNGGCSIVGSTGPGDPASSPPHYAMHQKSKFNTTL